MLSPLLLTAQAAGIAASIYSPIFWVKLDAAAIAANGSRDTLLRTFHRQRATWRLASAVAVAGLASLPAGVLFYWLAAGQLSFGLLYFFAEFNHRLSTARNLAYVTKWHVSWNPQASYLDRWLWRRAWDLQDRPGPPINGPDPVTQVLAGGELQRLSAFSKVAAVLSYVLLFAAAILLA